MNHSGTSAIAATRKLATSMLWGGWWPGLVVAVLAVLTALASNGSRGVIGALGGAVLALGCGALLPAIMRWAAAANPVMIMGLAMMSFFTKLLLFLIVMLVFGDTTVFDRRSFGFTVLAVTVAWTAGEIVAFMRARVPTVVPETAAGPDSGTDPGPDAGTDPGPGSRPETGPETAIDAGPGNSSEDDTSGGSQVPANSREMRQPPT